MKQMYKVRTIEVLYCKDSTTLLSELMQYQGGLKLLVTYGTDSSFVPPTTECFRVINITRKRREYKGFINYYKLVKS